ncbi:MAG: cytochrome b/b6 domain-containing protein [Mariprofundaceae bacterium]|nr:cytochrome b/b6 domain-containing protein [Mariprofundaceae bacterium]
MRYSVEEKVLHFLIAGGMIFQLVIENRMRRPEPGKSVTESQIMLFGAHEFVGVCLLIMVITRFMLMTGNRKSLLRLFPWLEPEGRHGIMNEIRNTLPDWFTGQLKDAGEQDFLAKTVHGLGLLLALGLGLTGLVLFIGISPEGAMGALGKEVVEVHELLGTLLWVFITGHVVMTLYHQLLGHRVLQYIFWGADR